MGEVPTAVDPCGGGDEAEAHEGGEEVFLADEAAIDPEEEAGGGEEEEGHGLLEGFHPWAGAGEFFYEGGEEGEDEVGECEAEGHEGEAGEKLEGG